MNIPARDYLVFVLAGTQNILFIGEEDNWLIRLKSFICQCETNGRWEASEVKYGRGNLVLPHSCCLKETARA